VCGGGGWLGGGGIIRDIWYSPLKKERKKAPLPLSVNFPPLLLFPFFSFFPFPDSLFLLPQYGTVGITNVP